MATDDGNGLWVTVSELARLRGVNKSSISKRVARLGAQGYAISKPGVSGTKLISVAAFDLASGEATDLVRATNGAPAPVTPPPASGKPGEDLVYAREQARNAAYAADIKKLTRDEMLGRLLPIDEMQAAMATCAEAMVRVIDGLPSHADDIAAAVARDGSAGVRKMLKDIGISVREAMMREMRSLERRGQRDIALLTDGDEADEP